MSDAFRSFMDGLIDYAGLFPPARLDLDTAIRNYARYRGEPDAWMLGSFVVPASLLPALEPYGEELFTASDTPFRFSVLLDTGNGEHRDWSFVREQIVRAVDFLSVHDGRVAVDGVEAKIPGDVLGSDDPGATGAFLDRLIGTLREEISGPFRCFLESGSTPDWRATDPAAIEALAARGEGGETGFKLRCGGTEAEAIPPSERVAGAILDCRDTGIPLKCTAGLHHPLRHRDRDLDADAHGFLNVFGSGILARSLDLPRDRVLECLADGSPGNFRFDGDSFFWRTERVNGDAIRRARRDFATTFGSCSFDEPREDLRDLGMLD